MAESAKKPLTPTWTFYSPRGHFSERQLLLKFHYRLQNSGTWLKHSLELLFERTRRNSELTKSWPIGGRGVDLHKFDLIPCEGWARQDS